MNTLATLPIRAFVGLGANLGDRSATLDRAFGALADIPGTRVVVRSSVYVSAPRDAGGPDYFNAVAELGTTQSAEALLKELQAIEQRHGRERPYRNAPRTLDLDLLLYGDATIATDALSVPHPRLHERAFVLRPLAEIAPLLVMPGLGALRDCLPRVADQRVDRLPPC